MRSRRRVLFFSCVATVLVAACGSRTGLLVPPPPEGPKDAAVDQFVPVPDAGFDAFVEEDAFIEEDALPPIDVVPPPPDAPNDCPDASSTLVYLISESNELLSFNPPTAAFKRIGMIACPAIDGDEPFSMAVDRTGIAYIVFSPSGQLFRVSTASAACEPTGFVSEQQGFSQTFGMGFSANETDGGETLYVAGDDFPSLATIDVNTFQLHVIGAFNPSITRTELTGTGAGGLFGFWEPEMSPVAESFIVQIDKTNAQVTGSSSLPGVNQGNAWAFAFYGGEFYTFTAPTPASTVVQRFNPADNTVVEVASTPEIIVGAGVSTCAPQR